MPTKKQLEVAAQEIAAPSETIKSYKVRMSTVAEMTPQKRAYYRIDEAVDAVVTLSQRDRKQLRIFYGDGTCSYPSLDFDDPHRLGDHIDPEWFRVCTVDRGDGTKPFECLTTRRPD